MNLDLEKTNQLGESSSHFIFAAVNLDPIVIEEKWTISESRPNDFVEKVNRGEELRWGRFKIPFDACINRFIYDNYLFDLTYMYSTHFEHHSKVLWWVQNINRIFVSLRISIDVVLLTFVIYKNKIFNSILLLFMVKKKNTLKWLVYWHFSTNRARCLKRQGPLPWFHANSHSLLVCTHSSP